MLGFGIDIDTLAQLGVDMISSSIQTNAILAEYRRVYDEMDVHVNGTFPEKLISRQRPHEPQEIYEYRMDNYEPITKGIIREAINSLFRIFNERHYDIKVSDELAEHIEKNIFENTNFITWVQNRVLYQMILDPNGLLAVLPSGDGIMNPDVAIVPKVHIIPSYDIIDYNKEYVIFKSFEKCCVTHYNRTVMDGGVYYILTNEYVVKISQTGKKADHHYAVEYKYKHDIGEIPCTVLGGEWNSERCVFESYFNAFVPFANEAIKQYSDAQASWITTAFPIKVVTYVECDAGCTNGKIFDNEKRTSSICGRCHGLGKTPPSSPYGDFILPQANHALGEKQMDVPIQYVSPPVEILKLQRDSYVELLQMARKSLHIDDGDARSRTGDAKNIDKEREYAMILKISNNVFGNLIYQTLWCMECYMNVVNPEKPNIVKPREFLLKSEDDLMVELSKLKDTGVAADLVKEVLTEVIERRWAGNEEKHLNHKLLMEYDVLYPYGFNEKISMKGMKLVCEDDILKSLYASFLLEQVLLKYDMKVSLKNKPLIKKEMDKLFEVEKERLKKDMEYMTGEKNDSLVYEEDKDEHEDEEYDEETKPSKERKQLDNKKKPNQSGYNQYGGFMG